MNNWPDEKILNIAVWYIKKHTMDPESWQYTRLTEHHPGVLQQLALQSGELPIVTSYISDSSWYALTTRRVVGTYNGISVDVPATAIIEDKFGNFKGYGSAQTEIMALVSIGMDSQLEYETGKASMAPIYYFRFWAIKYPILDKLKDNPNAKNEA